MIPLLPEVQNCLQKNLPNTTAHPRSGFENTSIGHTFSSALHDNRMPFFESRTSKLCVDDILAFSDTELVRYLQEHRRQDGGFDLEFEGWENLPKDQRDNLAQKLR